MHLGKKSIGLMQVVITDANIFIDLYELELLEPFFQLPYDINTSVFVLEELEEECSQLIQAQCTILYMLDSDKSELDLLNWSSGFTFTDKSILYFAKQRQMLVFSGEKKMKKWCQKNKLESHGILFIFQKFIDEGIFSKTIMTEKLRELMDINHWLPTDVCLGLLDKWSD